MRYEVASGVPAVDFNRRVLAEDLISLKHHIKELNEAVVKDLDEYFDAICELARMDAGVFKGFIRRLLRGRK